MQLGRRDHAFRHCLATAASGSRVVAYPASPWAFTVLCKGPTFACSTPWKPPSSAPPLPFLSLSPFTSPFPETLGWISLLVNWKSFRHPLPRSNPRLPRLTQLP